MGQTRLTEVEESTSTPDGESEEEKTGEVTFQHRQQTHTSHEPLRSNPVQANRKLYSSNSSVDTVEKLSEEKTRKDDEASEKRKRKRAGKNAEKQRDKGSKRRNSPRNFTSAYSDHLKNMHRAQAIFLLKRAAATRNPAAFKEKHKEARQHTKYTTYDSVPSTSYTNTYGYKRRRVRFSLGRFIRRHAAGLAGALLFVVASLLVGRYLQVRRLLRKRIAGRKSVAPADIHSMIGPESRPHPSAISYRDLLRRVEERLPPCPPLPEDFEIDQPVGRINYGPRDPVPVRATSRSELEWPYSEAAPEVAASGVLERVFDITPRFFPKSTEGE